MTTTFTGTAGRDTLVANTDSNLVTGGAGDDDLILSQGNTTLVFDRGFGNDVLTFDNAYRYPTSGSVVSYQIKFGPGLSASDLQLSYADYSQGYGDTTLVLSFANSSDKLSINLPPAWQNDIASPYLPVVIEFDDGTVLTQQDLYDRSLLSVQTGTFLHAISADSPLSVLGRGPHVLGSGPGDATLIAGSGADSLSGGGGNDTFVFNADWGTDNGLSLVQTYAPPPDNYIPIGPPRVSSAGPAYDIVNAQASGQSVIRFSAGTNLSDLKFAASGADLLITRVNGPGGIKVQSYFDGIGNPDVVRVEAIEFSDGTSLSRDAVMSIIMQAHPGIVSLQGGASNEVLTGGSGDDTLVGGAGNDRYIGGAGNDVFVDYSDAIRRFDSLQDYSSYRAAGGDDTYVFNRGFGQDVIYEYGGNDVIEFGADIAPEDIAITKKGGAGTETDTVIIVKGTTDRLVMAVDWTPNGHGHYLDSRPIQTIHFANGVVWGATEIAQQIAQYVPPAGSTDLGIGSIGPYWTPKAEPAPTLGIGSPVGTAYADAIYLSSTTTQASGGQGNDYFIGAGAASGVTFNYDKGDGSDSIGVDSAILSFGSSIVKADIQFVSFDAATGGALLSTGAASRDRIYVKRLTAIQFADGTTLSGTSLADFANASPLVKVKLTGTSGNDSLVGRSNDDTLDGLEGDDTLSGLAGADTLSGGVGNDSLLGGDGNDMIYGLAGNDALMGDAGDDQLSGGAGNDTLTGGAGVDTYTFNLGDGHDLIQADASDSIVLGTGITSSALQVANDGGDLLISMASAVDQLRVENYFGQRTGDSYRAVGHIYADNGAVAWTSASIIQKLTVGGSGNDTLVGTGLADNKLSGGAGNDVITGGSFDERIEGGTGNDSLTGGGGADTYVFNLGDGKDFVHADAQDTIELGAAIKRADLHIGKLGATGAGQVLLGLGGTDSITLDNAGAWGNLNLVFADGSHVSGSAIMAVATKLDDLTLTGTAGADSLIGGDGNDTLIGLAGNDTLVGGKGNDRYEGGAGDDAFIDNSFYQLDPVTYGDGKFVTGGSDTYVFNVGFGHDSISEVPSFVPNSGTDVIEFGAGIRAADLVVSAPTATPGRVLITSRVSADSLEIGPADIELFKFADGTQWTSTDVFSRIGQQISGSNGKDTLVGGDGDDVLSGLAGNDSLTGAKGYDKLDGGLGNDTLAGGLGNDTLIGGKGNDTYLFNRGEGHDTIVDTDSTWFNADLLKMGDAKSNQLWLTRSGYNLDISIIGTTDSVTIQDWFKASSNQVEKITALGDNKSLSASKVNALVNAMASFTPSAMAGSTLPANTPAAITKLIATSWA